MAGTSPDSLEPSIEAPTDYLAPPLDRCRLAPVRVASRYGPLSKLIGCNREIDAWIPTTGISEHSVTLSLIRRSDPHPRTDWRGFDGFGASVRRRGGES